MTQMYLRQINTFLVTVRNRPKGFSLRALPTQGRVGQSKADPGAGVRHRRFHPVRTRSEIFRRPARRPNMFLGFSPVCTNFSGSSRSPGIAKRAIRNKRDVVRLRVDRGTNDDAVPIDYLLQSGGL